MTLIKQIENWFKAAVPDPVSDDRIRMFGKFLKQVELVCRQTNNSYPVFLQLRKVLQRFFNNYQQGYPYTKKDFEKSIADLIFRAIGLAYMHGIDIEGALNEVNRSNWSKFVDGKPVFDENGKIKKGDGYTPPDLSKFVGE